MVSSLRIRLRRDRRFHREATAFRFLLLLRKGTFVSSPESSDVLSHATLQAAGIEDAERALRLLRDLAGQGVSDEDLAPLMPPLLTALQQSPDPDRALAAFARWF